MSNSLKTTPTKNLKSQKGVALIIVLLIVAIVSVLATKMGSRLQLQVKRASNIKENNQAYWYAMGAEQYAKKSLTELFSKEKVIHLNQPWNQEFTFPIEGGGIQAQLIDLQSCFNLNALGVTSQSAGAGSNRISSPNGNSTAASPSPNPTPTATLKDELKERLNVFEQLVIGIDAEIPSYNIEIMRDSLADWLDKDSRVTGLGAEDNEYESRQFPYMAANALMVHESELRLVNGVEASWLPKVLELVCVIPNDDSLKINVNTVSEENVSIIAAMTGMDISQAQSAISARGEKGFQQASEFLDTPEVKAVTLNDNQKQWFDVTTSHFILHTKTKYNNATFAMQTVFKIEDGKKVSVIRREFSGF
ncbi:type II secretion system minor pseudopilin GspK [Paraglaciecola aquimarina]|uniref:Type II secretion system protein K n=1 Tax=Paraglaciecola algarum TaxID=3050085 RepID=A0ABS9D5X1_9ALTE|nr:type II secretion system minor pseudopilin GspK [Paraglaciecola sp. G1-23]MCF2947423.1 type II secretion system minor pseudopilin GspK [Paraglaciecola sp. G1-23]